MSNRSLLGWTVDASTFIHFVIIERVRILVAHRAPLSCSEYVFRQELTNSRAHEKTRQAAEALVTDGSLAVHQVTLEDLARLATLGRPRRRVGLGEATCALVAEREGTGVLCDDHRARGWLMENFTIAEWQSIEEVLVTAALALLLTEYDLDECQQQLQENAYGCDSDLRVEFLQRRLNASAGGASE